MTYFKLLLTAVFWGGTFIAGRLLASDVDPYSAAFLRFAIASFFLILLTYKMEKGFPKIEPDKFIIILLLGATGIFSYNICFFWGLKYIQANQASLIIACNPVFISLCAALFFKERLSRLKIFGILLSVTGALLVISKGNLPTLLALGLNRGELLIFGCVISWVIYSILGKKAMTSLSPIASVCYSSVCGTVFLFFPALLNNTFTKMISYSIIDWSCLIYLGFFGTVLGFLWYYEGIDKIGPTKAGIFINFVPISAIVLSFFILDEKITPSLIIGALFVIAGVYLTNRIKSNKRKN